MGQNGGRRPGAGRPRGPSKETIARALAVEKVEAQARGEQRQLAKDVLEKGMKICEGAAGAFQPAIDPATGKPDPADRNWAMFGEWVDRMGFFARELAKYQSPTYKAIMTAPAPELAKPEERRRFTLRIFEGGRPAGVGEILPPEKKAGG